MVLAVLAGLLRVPTAEGTQPRSKPNAHVDRISDAAKIPQFKEFNMFRMTCTKANCLLKVKDGGIVEARVGDSVGRIGIFAKLQGKRWRKGELDYNTNISAVHPIKKAL